MVFCIVFPLMMTINNKNGVLLAAGTIAVIGVIIVGLIKTWAKKK